MEKRGALLDNELYRGLQRHLDRLPIGFPATESGVEIELLRYLFAPLEARVALCMSLVKNTVSRIHRRYLKEYGHLEREELATCLEAMFMKGNIRRSDAEPWKYGLAMLAIGIFEFHVDDLTPELVDILHRYYDEGFMEEFFHASLPQLRTSPHMKAIVPEHRIDTYDNMREYVRNTSEKIHVANCVCKQSEKIAGNMCRQTDNFEICITFGESSYEARGRARGISRDECLALLDMAEERGLVIQPANSLQPFCICLCCGCCCGVLTSAKKFEKPAELFATNYYAELDAGRCTGCGICIKRCQMDAITRVDKKTVSLDPDRCIGCGLCVTRCRSRALELKHKKGKVKPPMNTEMLYLSILSNRAGKMKMVVNLVKLAAGMRL